MFRKVNVFIDSKLCSMMATVPGQTNNPAWETCFRLIPLFLPVTPYGIYKEGDLKDKKVLLRRVFDQLHGWKNSSLFIKTSMHEAVEESRRIEATISYSYSHNPEYELVIRYYMKANNEPIIAVIIKMGWDGEILSYELKSPLPIEPVEVRGSEHT